MSALDKQVDGNHHKNQKIQPLELAYMLGETPAFTKLAKYLTRDKNNKFVNIDKARHYISLEKDLKKHVWKYSFTYLHRLYWKTFKKGTIHPLIKEFNKDVNIQYALHYMFLKEYTLANFEVIKYRMKCKEFGVTNEEG